MLNLNFIAVASFAFKHHCSFVGGRPASNVLKNFNGEIVFMFRKQFSGNYFIQWVRCNFDCFQYQEQTLNYKGVEYISLFLLIQHKIPRKFLYSFRNFLPKANHSLGYFLK